MALTPEQLAVLKKYWIVDPSGNPVITNIKKEYPDVGILGEGPKMEPAVYERLASLSNDPQWLDWIFFTAAGGAEAEKRHAFWVEGMEQSFLDRFARNREEEGIPTPRAKEMAQEKLPEWRERFKHYLVTGDEGVLRKNKFAPPLSYYRTWPGGDDRYAKIEDAVKRFQKALPMIKKYNSNRMPGEQVPLVPGSKTTPDDLLSYIEDARHGLGAEHAQKDVRIGQSKPIYDDDYVTVIVPTTHAAAVRYGRKGWAWADPAAFQSLLKDRHATNPWKTALSSGILAYLRFNVPVASWIRGNRRFYLTNLTLRIPLPNPNDTPQSLAERITIHDEENRANTNPQAVRQRIMDEATREDDPTEEETPIKTGAPAYSPEEALKIIAHFDKALDTAAKYVIKKGQSEMQIDFKVPGFPNV